MPKRDYASQKKHSYKTPRKTIRRDKLRKEIKRKQVRVFLGVFSLVGFLACIFYWLLLSSLFTINQLEVKGEMGEAHVELLAFARQNLQGRLFFILRKNNYFLFDDELFFDDLTKKNDFEPPIYDFEVYKDWPHGLVVNYKHRVAYLRVIAIRHEYRTIPKEESVDLEDLSASEESMDVQEEPEEIEIEVREEFLIDSEGVIVANSVLNEEVTMPAIELLTETRFATGQEILKRGVIDQIVKIGDLYSRQGLPKIKHFKINKDFKQLDLVTSEFQIYISLDYSLQAQIDNLLLTLEKVGDKVQSVEYIDLRIKNRAYVCCYLEGFE